MNNPKDFYYLMCKDIFFHNYMTLEFIYNHENVIQKDLARLFHRNQSTITRSMINWKIKDLLKEFMMIIIKKIILSY